MQQRTAHVVSGFILLTVASVSLLFVIFCLTSFQAYQRMRQVTVGSEVYSVWRLEQLLSTRLTRINEIDQRRGDLKEATKKFEAAKNAFRAAYDRLSDKEIDVDRQLSKVYQFLKTKDPTFQSKDSYREKFADINARLKLVTDAPADIVTAYKEIVDTNTTALQGLERDEDRLRIERERLKDALTEAQNGFNESTAKNELPPTVSGNDAVKLTAALDEYAAVRSFMLYTIEAPYEFTIILIVICSGFLGSSVHLASNFVGISATQPPSVFITRFVLGALTSLVLFIFIQAGALLAIDQKALNQSVTSLNPYFISFVGIVGGLSTERVLSTFSDIVNRYFSNGTLDRSRYALDPVKAFVADQAALGAFCKSVEIAPEDLKRMVEGNDLLQPAMQTMLTLWLKADRRTLFTDIAPERKPPDTTPPGEKQPDDLG